MKSLTEQIRYRFPGLLYLLLALTGFFTSYVMSRLSAFQGDSTLWFSHVIEHLSLYKWGMISFFLMNISWILLAYTLYHRFRKFYRILSDLMFLSVIVGASLVFGIILLRSFPLFTLSFEGRLLPADFSSWIDLSFFLFMMGEKGNFAANLFYAIWLFPLALIYIKLYRKPLIIGILLGSALVIAGGGYLADFLRFYLFPQSVNLKIIDFTFWGEVVLLFWMLVFGVNPSKKESLT